MAEEPTRTTASAGTGHDQLTGQLTGQLADLLGHVWGGAWSVDSLARLTGGASRETWAFDADGPDGQRAELILQRELPRPITTVGATTDDTGMAAEAGLLRAAASAGVPVPEVVAASGDAAVGAAVGAAADADLGASFVVSHRVAGETIARRILRDEPYAQARAVLARQCGEALAAIHAIPLDAASGLEHPDQLTRFTEVLDELGQPHPAFELGLRRLTAEQPAQSRTTLVHGDFRLGNLVVGRDGLRAVLDWELAHVGDPLEDLGWLCVKAWRFGGPGAVGGFGAVDDLVETYEEASGHPVDREALAWWQAMGTLKWGVMCITQASRHLSGATRSVELAAIGRRVCENEHDLLVLLGSTPPAAAATAEPASERGPELHDVPTVAGLVEAVREWVQAEVAGADGRLRFHARVAANVLATVERELALGAAQRAEHRARLDALGYHDDAALAAAIRAGQADDRLAEVTAAVHASVVAKLEVANPRYLSG